MKLKNELPEVTARFEKINNLDAYAHKLYETKDFKDFETRLAYDCFNAVYRAEDKIVFYDNLDAKYPGFSDNHLTTLLKAALRNVYPEIVEFE